MVEHIPADEARQIDNIVALTKQQLEMRYPESKPVLRGVHAKDHGCVCAEFKVTQDLPAKFHHGVFAYPGRTYSALVRFSNAATNVGPDTVPASGAAAAAHGSRGMAIKLLGVEGPMIGPVHGAPTQDFLMINQPVFAFANVADYEVLSRVLVEFNDQPQEFFKRMLALDAAAQQRAKATGTIIARIRSTGDAGQPPVFQPPPASPVDNTYFGAAPFRLGPDQVMRFRARPSSPSDAEPNIADPNYLRTALVKRLSDQAAGPVVFQLEIQVRDADEIVPERDIENASTDWPETEIPFDAVGELTIPLQEFDTDEGRGQCERVVFSPWHSLVAHEPLGGINRLRRSVYEMSSRQRSLPKEPMAIR